MKVYEAAVEALVAEGCDSVFGLLGDAIMPLWQTMHSNPGIRIVSAKHEAAAVAMADGWAQATAKVGVAAITQGPGLTQIGTSLVAAARGRTPMIVLVGDVPASDLNHVQKFDHKPFVTACECAFVSITGAGNVAREMAEAFHIARTERRPVIVNLPTDVQDQSLDWGFEYHAAKNFVAPSGIPAASELDRLAHDLAAAKRPVIIAGMGARRAGAGASCIELANEIGALLATSLRVKGLFSGNDWDIGIAGAFASAPAEELFSEADFVLGVGAELGYYTTEGGLLFPEARVARIDSAPAPMQLGVVPGQYLCGDALEVVQLLVQAVKRIQGGKRAGFRTEQTRQVLSRPAPALQRPSDGMDPRELARSLSLHIPKDAVITLGAGHFWAFFLMYASIPPSVEFHASYRLGAIGQTVPVGIGVGCAFTGRPNLILDGDGGIMMNIQELETITRNKLPTVILIWNDCGYGAEVHKLRAKNLDPEMGRWGTSPDFVAIARAFGGEGRLVTEAGQVGAALKEGFASKGLFVIDARVSPSVVSDPYQKVQFGVANSAPHLRYERSIA